MVFVRIAGPRKFARIASLPVFLAALLLTGCQRTWTPCEEDEPVSITFPTGALKDYLPADAAAVITLDARRFRVAPAARKGLGGALECLLGDDGAGHGWLPLTGADPLRDLDEARVVLSARDVYDPLFLLRGRFDPSRFQTGPGQLSRRVVDQHGSRFVLFEYADRQRRETVTLALAGETLVASDSPAAVLAALRHAATPGPTPPLDSRLRGLLDQVDRRQHLWLAVSMAELRPVPKLMNKGLELVLRPVFQYAEEIQGGLTCAQDVRAEFVFRARDEAEAQKLEELLRSSCEVAQGVYLLPGVDRSLLPLFQLAGSGEVTRDGAAVRLTCRVAGE